MSDNKVDVYDVWGNFLGTITMGQGCSPLGFLAILIAIPLSIIIVIPLYIVFFSWAYLPILLIADFWKFKSWSNFPRMDKYMTVFGIMTGIFWGSILGTMIIDSLGYRQEILEICREVNEDSVYINDEGYEVRVVHLWRDSKNITIINRNNPNIEGNEVKNRWLMLNIFGEIAIVESRCDNGEISRLSAYRS